MKRYIVTIGVLFFASILGFVLPPQMMKWEDEQQVNISYAEKSEEVVLVSQTSLSLTEKMELFQRETANTLGIAKGKNYDQESIQPKVLEELQKLCNLGILDIDVEAIEFHAIEGGFVVDTADSTQTMNIWTIYAYQADKGYDLLLMLDDETGKILSLRQSNPLFGSVAEYGGKVTDATSSGVKEKSSTVAIQDMEKIAEKWAEYLGLEIVETYRSVTGTMDVDKEIEAEIKTLTENGLETEEAYQIVHEAWGIDPEYRKGHLLCVVQDDQGMASYLIRKEIATIILSINLSM